jgi:hypothetical protein
MCKHITRHSCGGLKANGNHGRCFTPTADGKGCQRFHMTIAEGVCGGCYVCNPEIAEAKRKSETEAATKETIAAANQKAKANGAL